MCSQVLQEENRKLREGTAELEKDIRELEARATKSAEDREQQLQAALKEAKEHADRLEKKVDTFQKKEKENGADIAELQDACEEASVEIERLHNECSASMEEVARLTTALATCEAQREEIVSPSGRRSTVTLNTFLCFTHQSTLICFAFFSLINPPLSPPILGLCNARRPMQSACLLNSRMR